MLRIFCLRVACDSSEAQRSQAEGNELVDEELDYCKLYALNKTALFSPVRHEVMGLNPR